MIEVVIILAIVILSVFFIISKMSKDTKYNISFRESMYLANLPIITFQNNNIKLNFLLDTGSTESHIAEYIVPKLTGKYEEIKTFNFIGSTGEGTINKVFNLDISYKDKSFNTTVLVNKGLNEAFKNLKQSSGVTVHGILGSSFFEEYKYIIDFKDLVCKIK